MTNVEFTTGGKRSKENGYNIEPFPVNVEIEFPTFYDLMSELDQHDFKMFVATLLSRIYGRHTHPTTDADRMYAKTRAETGSTTDAERVYRETVQRIVQSTISGKTARRGGLSKKCRDVLDIIRSMHRGWTESDIKMLAETYNVPADMIEAYLRS